VFRWGNQTISHIFNFCRITRVMVLIFWDERGIPCWFTNPSAIVIGGWNRKKLGHWTCFLLVCFRLSLAEGRRDNRNKLPFSQTNNKDVSNYRFFVCFFRICPFYGDTPYQVFLLSPIEFLDCITWADWPCCRGIGRAGAMTSQCKKYNEKLVDGLNCHFGAFNLLAKMP